MKSKNIHLLIAAILAVALYFILSQPVCLDMGLTTIGASTLAIFIATIYLWITYGTGWISLLSIGLLGFTGIAPANTILANSFGNSTTVIVIGTLMLCVALEETGVAKLIANWFISRKFVENRPYMFFAMFFLAALIVAWFVTGTPVAVIFVTLGLSVMESIGYGRGDKFSMALIMGTIFVIVCGMAATPIGHPIVLTVLTAMTNIAGEPVSWTKYMMIGIPFSIIGYLLVLAIIKFLVRPDCSKFVNYSVEDIKKDMVPLDTRGKIISVIYVLLIIWWLFPDTFGTFFPTIKAFIKSGGEALPCIIAAAIACGISVGGKPVLGYKHALSKISWPLVYFIATIFLYAAVLRLETGGINVFLSSLVSPITSAVSPFVMVAIFLGLVTLLTNFISNAVTGAIGVTICVPLLAANPATAPWCAAFAVLVAILCNYGIMTPGGSGFVAIALDGDYVQPGDMVKYGLILCILTFLVALAFWPLCLMVLA